MKRPLALLCASCVALVLSGCGASAPVKPDSQALSGIRTVAIIKAPEPNEYTVIDKGSLAGAAGAVGAAATALDANKNKKGLLGAMSRTRFSFAEALTAELQTALRARGYEARVIPASRQAPHKLIGEYGSLVPSNADAVLDIATKGAGYSTQHWMTSSFWRPEAYVEVALFSRKAGAVVYGETFMYGYHNPLMSGTDLDAPAAYRFSSKEAMEAAPDEQLVGGLKDAAKAIAGRIASNLGK